MTTALSTQHDALLRLKSAAPAIDDADGFYEALLDAHRGLDDEQSAALNARLILVLAQQIGHADVLRACIEAAVAAGAALPVSTETSERTP